MTSTVHCQHLPKINVGDFGYRFLKEFDSGWYNGTVIEILPDAIGRWDRRCVYEDGDCVKISLLVNDKACHNIAT
jgi:hypothetical protein